MSDSTGHTGSGKPALEPEPGEVERTVTKPERVPFHATDKDIPQEEACQEWETWKHQPQT